MHNQFSKKNSYLIKNITIQVNYYQKLLKTLNFTLNDTIMTLNVSLRFCRSWRESSGDSSIVAPINGSGSKSSSVKHKKAKGLKSHSDLSSPSSVEGISLYNGHSIKACGKMKQIEAIEYEFWLAAKEQPNRIRVMIHCKRAIKLNTSFDTLQKAHLIQNLIHCKKSI